MPCIYETAEALPDVFLQNIKTEGGVLLRHAIASPFIEEMRSRAFAVYEQMDCAHVAGQLPQKLEYLWKFGHIESWDLDTQEKGYIYSAFVQSPVFQLTQKLWPEGMIFIGKNCAPRRQIPNSEVSTPVPYHQDESFLNASCLVLNFWIPLVDAGLDAPGLEIVCEGMDKLITMPKNSFSSYDDIKVSPSFMKQYDKKIWHPEVRAGDALVFSNYTLHKTYITPEMQKTRIAIEMRCTSLYNKAILNRDNLLEVKW